MSDLFSVEGRVAVVTGASSGIGQHLASALADRGAKVVGVARRAERLQDWAAADPDRRLAVALDVTCDELAGLAGFGSPDILINCAGLNPRKPAAETRDADWAAALAVNLTAPFRLARALAPAMIERGWGRVINFASLQSQRAFPGGMAYGAGKGGVVQLTRAMAQEWSPHGITANAIAPGFFPTELTAAVFEDDDRAARNAAQTCVGRNGTLDDLVGPLLFLCSASSDYVTGQTLFVDGGFTAK